MVEAVALSPKGAAVAMEVLVRGKIVRQRRHEGVTYTQIVTPAADEYSQPQTVEVRSKVGFGQAEELVTVHCRLGGYPKKQYTVNDQATGEVRRVFPVDNTLTAVE